MREIQEEEPFVISVLLCVAVKKLPASMNSDLRCVFLHRVCGCVLQQAHTPYVNLTPQTLHRVSQRLVCSRNEPLAKLPSCFTLFIGRLEGSVTANQRRASQEHRAGARGHMWIIVPPDRHVCVTRNKQELR